MSGGTRRDTIWGEIADSPRSLSHEGVSDLRSDRVPRVPSPRPKSTTDLDTWLAIRDRLAAAEPKRHGHSIAATWQGDTCRIPLALALVAELGVQQGDRVHVSWPGGSRAARVIRIRGGLALAFAANRRDLYGPLRLRRLP